MTIVGRETLQKLFIIAHKQGYLLRDENYRFYLIYFSFVLSHANEGRRVLRATKLRLLRKQGILIDDEYDRARFRWLEESSKERKEASQAQGRTQLSRSGSSESCLHAFANIATGIGANRSEELIN